MTNTAGIPGDRICSFIERVEHIDEEIKALNEGKKEVFAEAKGEGFDVKVLKEILGLPGMNRSDVRTILETSLYRPVKVFLEGLGFVVKGEVRDCDLVALWRKKPSAATLFASR